MKNVNKATRLWALLFTVIVLFGMQSQTLFATDAEDEEVAKVVYHVDFADPARLSAMLVNIYNMANTYEDDFREYDIRVVFNAHGIRFLTTDRLAGTPFEVDDKTAELRKDLIARLKSLQNTRNINLSFCNITREAINLGEDALIPGVNRVTSGVVEVANLQHQGFAYLKVQ